MNAATKRLALALVLSLGLNVFLGGFVAARMIRRHAWSQHQSHHEEHGAGPFFGPRGLLRDAKGPAGEAAHRLMHQHGEALRAERGRLREAQAAVGNALAAEPFDAERLRRALAELRQTTARSQELMHGALVELARELPPEQRRELGHKRGHGRGMAGRGGF